MNELDQEMSSVLSNLDSMIESAPENSAAECAIKTNDRTIALGSLTGWPEKYSKPVAGKLGGKEWLSAYEVARDRIDKRGIVVFYGERGAGKTRMAAELAVHVGTSRYRTAMRFFLEIRATFRRDAAKTELQVMDDLTKTGLLVIDEIQERGETDFEDRLLTHLIDARYSACRPTIIIANLGKKELSAALGNSIVDRARENGKSIHFTWPSYRTIAD